MPGPECDLEIFMEQFQGCLCAPECSEDTCPCIRIFGPAYQEHLLLEKEFSSQRPSRSIFECGNNCKCDKDVCSSRLVQKGIQTKLRVIKTLWKGYGLVADEDIEPYAFICEYAGQVVSMEEARRRLTDNEKSGDMNYLIAVKEHSSISTNEIYVDPKLEGNIGRFINHSCDPNLIMIPVRVNHNAPRLALFARKKISREEELTFDYSGCSTLSIQINDNPSKGPPNENISFHTTTLMDNSHLKDVSLAACDSNQSSVKISKHDEDTYLHIQKKERLDIQICSLGANKLDIQSCLSQSLFHENTCNILSNKSTSQLTNATEVCECGDIHSCANSSVMHRKPCFCGSKNCKKFIPYDGQLFDHCTYS